MRQALALAKKGRLTAPPNPWVGCVIVKEGQVVGQGFHLAPGSAHAERIALEQAGHHAQGATVYVTLEPCSHHGRTPPCCDSLIQAGVKRVVIPMLDPDPRVAGEGKKKLERAGVEVTCGVAQEEVEKELAPYLYHRHTGLPYCLVKIASSLDGKAALANGESKWITTEEARLDAHYLRASSQAILIGSRTACLDQPYLTVRGVKEPHCQPLRVVLDRRGTVPLLSPLFVTEFSSTLVFTSRYAPIEYLQGLEKLSVESVVLPQEKELEFVLKTLGQRGVLQLMVEGGPCLQAAFFQRHLVQKVCVYLGACLLGKGSIDAFAIPCVETMTQVVNWRLDNVQRLGQNVRLDYFPENSK